MNRHPDRQPLSCAPAAIASLAQRVIERFSVELEPHVCLEERELINVTHVGLGIYRAQFHA